VAALDKIHDAVVRALEKDGWTITDDPLQLQIGKRNLSVDLGAERSLIGAEKDVRRIAVEIKTFGSASPVSDLQQAVGQYSMYESVLARMQPDRELYLAISREARNTIFGEELGRLMLAEYIHRIVCIDIESEEILEWNP
jgi:hypothetical protein